MVHEMRLHSRPFALIASGQKTIELRLYDDKRKAIQIGDQIRFADSADPDRQMVVTVKNLYIFDSFETLYQKLPLEKCGYLSRDLPSASPEDMQQYYPLEMQKNYGVVGIEIATCFS